MKTILVGIGILACVLATATSQQGVKLKVNLQTGSEFNYSVRQVSHWDRDGSYTDNFISQKCGILLKVRSASANEIAFEYQQAEISTIAKTVLNGSPGGSSEDETYQTGLAFGQNINVRVNSRGEILNEVKPETWQLLSSATLRYPTHAVKVGGSWTSTMPVPRGIDQTNLKVVYEVFDRQTWRGHDVLVIKFSGEPSKYSPQPAIGTAYVDIKTGLALKTSVKYVVNMSGTRITNELNMELIP